MSLGCRGVIGPNYNPRSGDVANVDDANKRKHESIGPAETGHNKTRIVRKNYDRHSIWVTTIFGKCLRSEPPL